MTTRVVYTALFGQHEKLQEQPVAADSDVRFVCFTDNPNVVSSSWDVVVTQPLFPQDPRRSQRDIKIRGHRELAPYEQWLYIDNTVRLHSSPEDILDSWLAEWDWAAIAHDAHSTTWEEFDANIAAQKDTSERINEQLHDYATHYPNVLDQRPLWNGFFARSNSTSVAQFAELWFLHVCRYSARDQLSIMVALSEHSLRVNTLDAQLRRSEWHSWPYRDGETEESKSFRHARTSGLKPMAEELTETRELLKTAEVALQAERDKRFFGLSGVRRRIDERRRAQRRQRRQQQKRS
mgnify:CR=1 FL=1